MTPKIHHAFYILSYFTFAVASFLIFYIAYLLFAPSQGLTNQVTINPTPMTVYERDLKVGDTLTFETTICSKKDLTFSYTPRFVNDEIVTMPERTLLIKKGCEKFVSKSFQIPQLSPGRYTFALDAIVWVNAVRREEIHLETQPFMILPEVGIK